MERELHLEKKNTEKAFQEFLPKSIICHVKEKKVLHDWCVPGHIMYVAIISTQFAISDITCLFLILGADRELRLCHSLLW